MTTILFWTIVGVLYALAYWRPGYACGYLLASYGLEQCAQALVPVATNNDTLCNYLTAGSVIVALVSKILREGGQVLRLRLPTLTVLALLVYCYATILWSLFPSTTQRILTEFLPYTIVFVGLAPLVITGLKDVRHALVSLLACSLVSLTLLVLFAEWGNRSVVIPNSEFETNPLALAAVGGSLLIIVGLSPDLLGRATVGRATITLLVAAVVAIVFLRTSARGQIIAALATVSLFTALGRGGKWLPLAAVAALGMLGSGFLDEDISRNAYRWDPENVQDSIVDLRGNMAEQLLEFWSHSPRPTCCWA